MNFRDKTFSLLSGKTNSEMSADEYNKMRQKELQRFDTLYDTSTVDGIRKIPAPEKVLSKTDSRTGKPEYILQLRAGQYEKEKKFDLAIECLRKSNELKMYSSIYYSENDYMRLVELLKRCCRFDEARTEEAHIKRLLASQNQYYGNKRNNRFNKTLKTLDTDLVEVSYVGACCPICGKYRGRIFSVSGKDKRFPKLPDDFHEDCGLIAFPFIYGVNEPQYCKSKDIIAYNNRPFRDTRTAEEKANYKMELQAQEEERQREQDKIDYNWLWEHLPETCPKSFGAYRRMKNSNSPGYQKLIAEAQTKGFYSKNKGSKSMYCKNCGQQIPNNTHFCGNCGAPQQPTIQQTQPNNQQPPVVTYQPQPVNKKTKKLRGCWTAFAVVVALLITFIMLIIGLSASDSSSDNNSTTEQVSTTEYITFEEFEKIETGMTYEEVVAIIGCEGKLVSSSDFGDGSTTETYSWSSKDLGSGVTYGATVAFIDNKVEFKQQIGLDIADDVSSAINDLY